MPLPSSGAIKFSNINTELSVAATTQRSLGGSTTRALYGVASGAIRLAADGYGKSASSPSGYIVTTGMSMYGSMQIGGTYFNGSSSVSQGTFPPSWNGNAYWAVLNSQSDVGETEFCLGWPTNSYDICIGDWGGILSGVAANNAYNFLTKVEFYNSSNSLVQTINKASFSTYFSGAIGQTCIRIPGVSSSLYSGFSPLEGTYIKWYFSQ